MYSKNVKKTRSVIKEIIGSNKTKQQLPDFFRDNNQEIRDYIEIANGFNNFFSQIGPKLASEIGVSNVSFESFLSEKIRIILNFPGSQKQKY